MIKKSLEEGWLERLCPEDHEIPETEGLVVEEDKIHIHILFPNGEKSVFIKKLYNGHKEIVTVDNPDIARDVRRRIKNCGDLKESINKKNILRGYKLYHVKDIELELPDDIKERLIINIVELNDLKPESRENLKSIRIDDYSIPNCNITFLNREPDKIKNMDGKTIKSTIDTRQKTRDIVREFIHDALVDYPTASDEEFEEIYISDEESYIRFSIYFDLGELVR